jgi:hypothetical protein
MRRHAMAISSTVFAFFRQRLRLSKRTSGSAFPYSFIAHAGDRTGLFLVLRHATRAAPVAQAMERIRAVRSIAFTAQRLERLCFRSLSAMTAEPSLQRIR